MTQVHGGAGVAWRGRRVCHAFIGEVTVPVPGAALGGLGVQRGQGMGGSLSWPGVSAICVSSQHLWVLLSCRAHVHPGPRELALCGAHVL